VDRSNAVKEETDEEATEIPPCVWYSGGENDSNQCADEENDRSVKNEVRKPAMKLEVELLQGENFTYHKGRLLTPFEYCKPLTPLRRSIVGYRAKKAG